MEMTKPRVEVLRCEMRTDVSECLVKSKRIDYVGGGHSVKETIERITTVRPYWLLSCGHWRRSGSGAILAKGKKVECVDCFLQDYIA